ncbi:MAG: hypothetical protein ACREHV_08665 [Rhizomicrobium sp.]
MKRRPYSAYAVLVELPRRISSGEPIDLEPIEREFFDRLKVGNRTYKTTSKFRLDDVDRVFSSLLGAAEGRRLNILDVAASSGVSSLRWLDSLRTDGFVPSMTVSDITAIAFLVTATPWFRVLVDRDNRPLEFEIFSRTIRGHVKKVDVVSGGFLSILAARALYRSIGLMTPTMIAGNPDRLARPAVTSSRVMKVLLVSNEVRRCPGISVTEDDITGGRSGEMTGTFDVIRAANILQTVYFNETRIRSALATLKKRLRGDGAWLIVCRTNNNGVNHASIFRIENGWFVVRARVGAGSEIESLVLSA